MRQHRCVVFIVRGIAGLAAAFGMGWDAQAAETQVRNFQVFVDNRPAGSYRMAIVPRADGSVAVTCQADVRVRVFVVGYHYSYRGTEVWKDGRLLQLDSRADDDGKQFAVTAQAEGEALRVRSNGQERVIRKDVWTTSCWQLPPASFRNRAIVLLDADTGREVNGNLFSVGVNRLNVAGQVMDCAHYRVTGGVQLELWFDAQERLVRQESVEDGHRTVLEMRR